MKVPQISYSERLNIDYRHFDTYNIQVGPCWLSFLIDSSLVHTHTSALDSLTNRFSSSLSSEQQPRFEFGFGLSYTTFKYDSLSISKSAPSSSRRSTKAVSSKIDADISLYDTLLRLQFRVTNTGDLPGNEVAQVSRLFMNWLLSSCHRESWNSLGALVIMCTVVRRLPQWSRWASEGAQRFRASFPGQRGDQDGLSWSEKEGSVVLVKILHIWVVCNSKDPNRI
jgi:hypothetical protein